jgi:hypothetical protein
MRGTSAQVAYQLSTILLRGPVAGRLFVMLFALLLTYEASFAQTQGTLRVTSIRANIRIGPGLGYAAAANAERGQALTFVGKDGDWFEVMIPQELGARIEKGYIHTSTVQIESDTPEVVQVAPDVTVITDAPPAGDDNLLKPIPDKVSWWPGPGYRGQSIAHFWSAIPAGGYIYTGETSRLLPVLGAVIGGLAMQTSDNLTVSLLGIAVWGGAWIYGVIDAPKSAERVNRARGYE